MKYDLFLDDERIPSDYAFLNRNVIVVRDYHSAVETVNRLGVPTSISFDHDLGKGLTGYDFAKWFVDYVITYSLDIPEDFTYTVHSMNPVGRENIYAVMKSGMRRWEKN